MSDDLICLYFLGATITAFSTSGLKYFYRCVLLWPIFWVYLLVIVVDMALREIRHG